uniref:C2H2-type domain-containing protein n=1 Tax=Caenorhabditis japonica TaxID=281687 RepID=A0A8R1DGD6_CAEJA
MDMEQSCSKTVIRIVRSPPPTDRPPNHHYPYSTFMPHVRTVQAAEQEAPPPTYRRNDPSNRNYRMRKRAPAQVYYCTQCNKHIKYPSKISEHIRKHTGEKPHMCPVCSLCFSQAHTLKTHMNVHVNEKPFKCSFCPASFKHLMEKNEHEEAHMHAGHAETMDESCLPLLQVASDGTPINEQVFSVYECPFQCGFQSLDESVVDEHILDHQRYDQVVWTDGGHTEQEEQGVVEEDGQQPVVDSDHIYQFFGEQFVPEVASEATIDHSEVVRRVKVEDVEPEKCSSPAGSLQFVNHFVSRKPVPVKLEEPYTTGEEELEKVGGPQQVDNVLDEKILIPEQDHHIFQNVILEEIREPEEGDVDELEDVQEQVRVIVNPNPPKRGFKSARDHEEASAALTEMVLDAATVEMVQPVHKPPYSGVGRRKTKRKAQNLDWIINAVAKGVDVNEASPHNRKKPVIHKCKYCGKLDKYPSKIAAHERTHTGEKPFKCDICGMAFSQRTPMRLHMRRHLDEKPYCCEVLECGEKFVSKSLLKMHFEKKHLGKRKYVCIRGCGRVFSSAFNQRHHEKKCEQNTYMTWIEEPEESEDEQHYAEEEEDDDEIYLEEMIDDPSTSEVVNGEAQYVEVEPVFLHQ